MIWRFLDWYKNDARKREIEKFVPDLLLSASMYSKGRDITKVLKEVSKANYRKLSKEIEKCLSYIEKGESIEKAFDKIMKRNNSEIFNKSLNLLLQWHKSGTDMREVFKEFSEDLLEMNALIRERIANFVIEKYTLLIAGGIIVPIVLGIIVKLVSGLEFSSLEEIGFGISSLQRKELLDTAKFSNQIYIAEYAVLASVFIAWQENHLKKTLFYAGILLPLSFIAYNFVQVM